MAFTLRTLPAIVVGNFLPQKSYEALSLASIDLREKIDRLRPTPLSLLSQTHPISGERPYRAVVIKDQFRTVHCADFADRFHTLTTFRDNHNIPYFVSNHLIAPLTKLPAISRLAQQGLLNWHCTFNTYSRSNNKDPFPFHQDIALNDVTTIIYNLGAQALYQVSDSEKCETISLQPNSLLILSGKLRCDQSVAPEGIHSDLLASTRIQRITFALGCTPHPFEIVKMEGDAFPGAS